MTPVDKFKQASIGVRPEEPLRREPLSANILHLDVNRQTVDLIREVLGKASAEISATITNVSSREAFVNALKSSRFNVILSENSLAGYAGNAPLFDARQFCPDVPFIVVTCEPGEERAVEAMVAGATDYIQIDRIEGLVPSIRRALGDAPREHEHSRKEAVIARQNAELARAHQQLQAVVDGMTEGLNVVDMQGNLVLVNARGAEMLGFTTPEEYRKALPEFIGTFEIFSLAGARLPFEQWPSNKLLHGESVRDYVVTVHRIDTDRYLTLNHNGSIAYDENGDPLYSVLTYRDVTGQIHAQEALRRKEEELREAQRVARVGSWYWDAQTDKVTVSDEIYELYGLDPAKPYPSLKEQEGTLLPARSWELISSSIARTMSTGEPYELECEVNHGKGGTIWIAARGEAVRDAQGVILGLRGIVQDITERRKAEARITFLASFPELNPNPVLEVNSQGRVSYANKAASRIIENQQGPRDLGQFIPADIDVLLHALARNEGAASYYGEVTIGNQTFGEDIHLFRDLGVIRIYANEITERKRAEQALRESEERYSRLFEKSPFASALTQMPEGVFVGVNDAFLRMFGFTREEVIGKTSSEVGISVTSSRANVADLLATAGVVSDFECQRLTKSGTRLTVLLNLDWITIGGVKYILASLQDITERKQAEVALRRQAQLIDLSPDAILVRAVDGTIESWSKGAETLYGWTQEEAIGQKTHVLLKTRSPNPLVEIIDETLRVGRWAGELTHTTKGGRQVVVQSRWLVQSEAGSAVQGILESNLDITDAKMGEVALRESEERFRTMADSTPVMIWVTNARGEIEFVNHAYEEFFGVTEAQAKSPGSWKMLVHPEDEGKYFATFAQALDTRSAFDAEARVRHHSDEWRWVHSYGAPRFSGSGEFLGHVGSSPDITVQKHAADALRASVENLRVMVSHASDAMMVIDGDGRIEAVSSLGSRLLGYEEGELVGERIDQFAETFSRLEASLTLENLRKGAPRPMTGSLRVKTKDGTTQWMSVTGNIVNLADQGEKFFVKFQKLDLPAMRDAGRSKQER